MHKTPTVDYPLGRSRFHAVALLVVLLGVAGVDVLWLCEADQIGWRHRVGVAASLVAAVMALRAWWVSPAGTLHWDGKSWSWESERDRSRGAVSSHLDLQDTLLLVFSPLSGKRCWLWLDRGTAPARWMALRRAVYAPGQDDAPASDGVLSLEPARRGGAIKP